MNAVWNKQFSQERLCLGSGYESEPEFGELHCFGSPLGSSK